MSVTGALRAVGRRIAAAPPWSVLLAAWTLLIVYAFPGLMTLDSYDHLREARAGIYTDSHPPIINLLWRILDTVITGPFGMLVLQSGLLLAGLYAILRWTFAPRRAAWWTTAVYCAPPVMTQMAVIWKDCVMAGLLVVGIAGLLSQRRAAKLGGLLAMLGAAAFRYNGLGATLPLVVLLFEWRPGMRWLPRYALATATWLVTVIAALWINAALTDRQMHYWHSSLAVFDIAGTLANVDPELPDSELRAELAGTQIVVDHDIHAAIRAVYSPSNFLPLLFDPKRRLWSLPVNGYEPAPEPQRAAIERAFVNTIERHPWPYLKHRLAVMGELLDLKLTRTTWAPAPREGRYEDMKAALQLSAQPSKVQRWLQSRMVWASRHTALFVAWVYLVLSLIMIPLAWRHRDVLALLLSGLLMEASLLPLVHARDFRYSHWMVITTLVSCIVLATRRYRAGRAAGAKLVAA